MTIEEAQVRVAELTELIDRYNYEYYMNDRSLVSDYEFDALLRELVELEGTFPQLASPTSPTRRVGGEVNKSFQQVRHRFPMLSLGNTYSIAEIEDFEARTRKLLDGTPFSYTCELKYDGVAVGLTYRHGELVQAVTRGNGTVGDDITANVRTIRTVPLRLRGEWPDDFEMRGEVVYPFDAFETMNSQRVADGDEPFANPRNAASGSLKLQDSRECAKRRLLFCAYFMMLPDGTPIDAPLPYFGEQGMNAMRVRLFVDPSKASSDDKGQGVCQDLDYVKALGKEIKEAGMALMLDFILFKIQQPGARESR